MSCNVSVNVRFGSQGCEETDFCKASVTPISSSCVWSRWTSWWSAEVMMRCQIRQMSRCKWIVQDGNLLMLYITDMMISHSAREFIVGPTNDEARSWMVVTLVHVPSKSHGFMFTRSNILRTQGQNVVDSLRGVNKLPQAKLSIIDQESLCGHVLMGIPTG